MHAIGTEVVPNSRVEPELILPLATSALCVRVSTWQEEQLPEKVGVWELGACGAVSEAEASKCMATDTPRDRDISYTGGNAVWTWSCQEEERFLRVNAVAADWSSRDFSDAPFIHHLLLVATFRPMCSQEVEVTTIFGL